jgi:hypothetical protein
LILKKYILVDPLRKIRLLHTIIWAIMAAACIYVLYAGIIGTMNGIVWASVVLISLEGIVLLFNKGTCPLTPLAGRYTADRKDNFDIYLPQWLARYNKLIFGIIFTIGILLVLLRVFSS